jgi:hypothetical protein
MAKWFKRYQVELYNKNNIEIKNWVFETKAEQQEQYYHLLNCGYGKSQIEKRTIDRLEDCE